MTVTNDPWTTVTTCFVRNNIDHRNNYYDYYKTYIV